MAEGDGGTDRDGDEGGRGAAGPGTGSRLGSGWRPERAIPISDAIAWALDIAEHRYQGCTPLPPDPLPVSSGVAALDRVCGGGLHLGTLTVVEADLAAQARALVLSAARATQLPTLLAAASVPDAARWLVAAGSGVPEALLDAGTLDGDDWDAVAAAIGPLADRPLHLADAATLPGLWHVVAVTGTRIVVVEDLERFGTPDDAVAGLARLATQLGVAVLATGAPHDPGPPWVEQDVVRVAMAAHGLGGRAALCRVDHEDAVAVAQVDVDCLHGALR